MLLNCGAGEDSWRVLDCKEIKPVIPKGNQPWIFIGRIDAGTEAPILWPLDAKNWLIGKDLMLGKTEGKRRRSQQRMRCLDSITDSMDMNLSKPRETAQDREVHGVAKSQMWRSEWTASVHTTHAHTHMCTCECMAALLNSACGYSLAWNPDFVHFNCSLCPLPSSVCALVYWSV